MRNFLLLANVSLLAGCLQVQSLGCSLGNVVCTSDGDPCAAAADCCSGLCTNGVCEAAPSCAPNGDACSAGADCCSLTCVSGTCSNGPMCAPDGDPCASNGDCCSQQCSNGACSSGPMCAADGDACSANADCCSQLCSNGACSSGPMCAADGDACNANADCCSQLCSNGACTANAATYDTSFEGACPNGWTLTGDWECGVPMNVGPATAYTGTQCIATKIAGNYNDSQTWDGTTATSPDIDLTNVATATLTFRMFIHTEGGTFDGANLQISTDGGITYALVNTVMPMYNLTIAGKPAWGGYQQALGWQLAQADLSGFAGKIIRLRFAFRSDAATDYPGVYIDDILVN